jgi:hypothetical protein
MTTAIAGHDTAFEQDVNAYLAILPTQLSLNEGKFALIGHAKLAGIFPSEQEAMRAGYERFGLNGFLVQEISRFDLEMGQHWLQA